MHKTSNISTSANPPLARNQSWQKDAIALAQTAQRIVESPDFDKLVFEFNHDYEPIAMTSILSRMHDVFGDHPILSYYYGWVWAALGDDEKAYESLIDALWLSKLNPNGICKRDFRNDLGAAVYMVAEHRRLAGHPERAKETLSMMPSTCVCETFAAKCLSNIHMDQQDYHSALEALFSVRNIERDADMLKRIGLCQSRMKQPQQAAITYRQVVEREPDNAKYWHHLGIALLMCGRLDESMEALKRAYNLEPKDAHIVNDLAYVLALLSKGSLAVKYANEAVTQAPGRAFARDTLAFAYLVAGHHEQALQSALKAIALDWNHAEAWYHAGVANLRLGNHTKAREIFNKLKTRDLAYAGFLATELQAAGSVVVKAKRV